MKKDAQAHTMSGELSLLDKYIADLIGFTGLSAYAYGAYLVKLELALISVGIILMIVAYKMAR